MNKCAIKNEIDYIRTYLSEHQSINSGRLINQTFLRILTLLDEIVTDEELKNGFF